MHQLHCAHSLLNHVYIAVVKQDRCNSKKLSNVSGHRSQFDGDINHWNFDFQIKKSYLIS